VIRSMTGFGQAETEFQGRILFAEIRTVNHRFLDLSIRLPRGMQSLEGRLRSHLQKRLSRGKVNLTVTWKGEAGAAGLEWNAELADRYVEILQEIRNRFDFREPVTLAHLLAHPDLLQSGETAVDDETIWSALRTALDGAVDDLVAMRTAEGERLSADLMERLANLRRDLAEVEARSPERAREAKEKLRTRVSELLQGETPVDEERVVLEASFQAERMDCTEECVRLASHFDQFQELLEKEGSAGRKLNFLLQEMNREAHTIGSKANDVTVAREVIAIKEEIEILREQVQNIE